MIIIAVWNNPRKVNSRWKFQIFVFIILSNKNWDLIFWYSNKIYFMIGSNDKSSNNNVDFFFKITSSFDERIRVALSNCTHIHISLNFKISAGSPGCSPRVFNIPKLLSFFNPKSSCQYCMIDIPGSLSTIINCINSSSIIFESSNNLEGNWDWPSIVESFSKFFFIALSDIEASVTNVCDWDWWSMNTCSIFGSVRISSLSFKTTNMSNIFKSMGWKTTFTAMVVIISSTINKLLFRES